MKKIVSKAAGLLSTISVSGGSGVESRALALVCSTAGRAVPGVHISLHVARFLMS